MKFEIINSKGKTVMHTECAECIPEKEVLTLMSKAEYKFKLDGKITPIKKLNEIIKEIGND